MINTEEGQIVVSFVDFSEVNFDNGRLKLSSPNYLFYKNYLPKQYEISHHCLIFYDGFFDYNYNYDSVLDGIIEQLLELVDNNVSVKCVLGKDHGNIEDIIQAFDLREVVFFSYNHVSSHMPWAEKFIDTSLATSIIYVEKFDGDTPDYYQYVRINLNRQKYNNHFEFGYFGVITPSNAKLVQQFNNLLAVYNDNYVLLKAAEGIDIADFVKTGYKSYFYKDRSKRRFLYFSFTEAGNSINGIIDTVEREVKEYIEEVCIVFDNIEKLNLEDQAILYQFLKNRRAQRIDNKAPDGPFQTLNKQNIQFYFFRTKLDLRDQCMKGSFNWELFGIISNMSFEIPSLDQLGASERKRYLHAMINEYAECHYVSPLELNENVYQKLIRYQYPYNIAEMKNIITNLYLRQKGLGESVDISNLPFKLEDQDDFGQSTRLVDNLRPHMKRNIESLLAMTDGNIAKAAKLAGLAINTFKQKMEECEVDIEYFKKKGT